MNKRFLSVLLVLTIVVTALVACNEGNTGNTNYNTESETVTNSETNTNGSHNDELTTDTETGTTVEPSESETDEPATGDNSENNTNSENSETPGPTETPEPHVHTYTESVTAATCTKDGKKTFACECGHTYSETIKATGHKYGEYVYNGDATSSKDGTKTATCSVCGAEDTKTASGTKLGYTFTLLNTTMYAKSSVNVRDLPSTDGKKIGSLKEGDEVLVTGKCNETGWYRVVVDEATVGYVSSSYLKTDKPTQSGVMTVNGFILKADEDGDYVDWKVEMAKLGAYEVYNPDGMPCIIYLAADGDEGKKRARQMLTDYAVELGYEDVKDINYDIFSLTEDNSEIYAFYIYTQGFIEKYTPPAGL